MSTKTDKNIAVTAALKRSTKVNYLCQRSCCLSYNSVSDLVLARYSQRPFRTLNLKLRNANRHVNQSTKSLFKLLADVTLRRGWINIYESNRVPGMKRSAWNLQERWKRRHPIPMVISACTPHMTFQESVAVLLAIVFMCACSSEKWKNMYIVLYNLNIVRFHARFQFSS